MKLFFSIFFLFFVFPLQSSFGGDKPSFLTRASEGASYLLSGAGDLVYDAAKSVVSEAPKIAFLCLISSIPGADAHNGNATTGAGAGAGGDEFIVGGSLASGAAWIVGLTAASLTVAQCIGNYIRKCRQLGEEYGEEVECITRSAEHFVEFGDSLLDRFCCRSFGLMPLICCTYCKGHDCFTRQNFSSIHQNILDKLKGSEKKRCLDFYDEISARLPLSKKAVRKGAYREVRNVSHSGMSTHRYDAIEDWLSNGICWEVRGGSVWHAFVRLAEYDLASGTGNDLRVNRMIGGTVNPASRIYMNNLWKSLPFWNTSRRGGLRTGGNVMDRDFGRDRHFRRQSIVGEANVRAAFPGFARAGFGSVSSVLLVQCLLSEPVVSTDLRERVGAMVGSIMVIESRRAKMSHVWGGVLGGLPADASGAVAGAGSSLV